MSTRIIKKYPNRRLYDTELSRYITLPDIRQLVMNNVDFKVVDTRNNEDLTRSILLQIILEEESGGEPLFSATMLTQIIRYYGGTVQGIFARYLEESMTMFSDQQDNWANTVGNTDPVKTITDLTQKNMEIWSDIQESFFQATTFTGTTNKNSKK